MIDYFAGLAASQQGGPATTEQATTRYHYLVATGQKANADEVRSTWSKKQLPVKVVPVDHELLKLIAEPTLDLAILPPCTFALHFTFSLAQPYLSKDDNPFYIIDNPIVRDKVFRLPMVRPSSWKGSLRHALWQAGRTKDDPLIQRLFGEANDNDNTGKAGRLHFYPTFFDRTSLEIINPHNHTTRVGKNPILLESVPADASGTFTLLYAPFDRIGEEAAETHVEVAADLKLVVEGVQAMMTLYGFGAKTSSGFGLAAERLMEGLFMVNAPDGTQTQRLPRPIQPETPQQPTALRTYLAEFPNEDFALKPDEWRKRRNATNSQREAYKAARAARQEYQQALAEHANVLARYQDELAVWESTANALPPAQTKRTFADFTTLVSQTAQVAQQLTQEDVT